MVLFLDGSTRTIRLSDHKENLHFFTDRVADALLNPKELPFVCSSVHHDLDIDIDNNNNYYYNYSLNKTCNIYSHKPDELPQCAHSQGRGGSPQ